MTTAEHFTRLAALNATHPNMAPPRNEIRTVFVCSACGEAHGDEDEAADCCRPEVLERYECPVCLSRYQTADAADECCPIDGRKQPKKCPICMRDANSFQIAADCCLHTHPTMTAAGRELVAQAVASGMPWADAIAAHANH